MNETRTARVVAQHRDRWLLDEPGREPYLAAARGRLRDDPRSPPVTGDVVTLDEGGAIAGIEERRTTITRRSAGPATAGQTLAANVDLALVAEPLPEPNERRLERFVALAVAGGVVPVVVLTKADLDPTGEAYVLAARLGRSLGGIDGHAISATSGEGLPALRAALAPGVTAALLGPSGAGKSTLVNALLGTDRQATGAVRANDGRGRHTTVTRELIELPSGAFVLDTPGIREVGLWDATEDAFADIAEAAEGCRFADCAHADEPGCAVREAITPERLEAWRKLAREQAWIDDRRAAIAAREASGRAHVKYQREARRAKGH